MWLKRGVLTPACVNEAGRIIVEIGEQQLRDRLNTPRSVTQVAAAARLRQRKRATRVKPAREDGEATINGKAERLPAPASVPEDPLLGLRMEKERLEIRRRQVALDIQTGKYVLAAEVQANRRRALTEVIQMVDAWLPTLISELGLDRKALDVARASYRAVRERQVAAMAAGVPDA